MISLNRSWRLGILPAIVLLVSCSQPQEPTKELCNRLNATIDQNVMAIAFSDSAGALEDKSAMQQSARAQDNANRLSVIMINVQLLEQNRCSSRTTPIEPFAYQKNAAACLLEKRLKRNLVEAGYDAQNIAVAAKKVAESCDFSKWRTQENK